MRNFVQTMLKINIYMLMLDCTRKQGQSEHSCMRSLTRGTNFGTKGSASAESRNYFVEGLVKNRAYQGVDGS